MRECFENRDIPMLQQLLMKMNIEEAKYHMKRCVDSGLWVPGATDSPDLFKPGEAGDGDDDDEKFDEPNAGPADADVAGAAATAAKATSSTTATDSSSAASTSAS